MIYSCFMKAQTCVFFMAKNSDNVISAEIYHEHIDIVLLLGAVTLDSKKASMLIIQIIYNEYVHCY